MTKYFLSWLTALLSLLLPVSLTAGVTDFDTEIKQSYIDDRENWDFIIAYFEGNNQIRDKLIREIKAMVETGLQAYDEKLRRIDKRAHELSFLAWNQGSDDIFAITLYNRQIVDLKIAFEKENARLTWYYHELETNRKQLDKLNTALHSIGKNELTPANRERQKSCVFYIESTGKTVDTLMAEYRTRITRAEAIRKYLDDLSNESTQRQQIAMNRAIFSPQGSFIALMENPLLPLKFWGIQLRKWIAIQIPRDPNFWSNFLLLLSCAGIPLLLLGRYLYPRLVKLTAIPEKYAKCHNFTVVIGFLVLALACFGSTFMLGQVESALFYRSGQFFFAIACLIMALGIRLDRQTAGRCLLLYSPLAVQHVIGITLCLLLVPHQPLIMLTPLLNLPVALITLWLLIRNSYPKLDLCFGLLTILLGLINTILSVTGLAYIAFTVMMFWFIALAGLQTGLSLSRLIHDYTRENTHRQITTCLLLTLLAPLLWLGIIGGMIYWTAGLFNSQELLYKILVTNFIPGKELFAVSIINLLIGLITALLLHFILSTIRHMVRIMYAEQAETGLITTFMTLGTYLAWGGYIIFLLLLFRVHPSSILVVLGGMSMGIGFGLKEIVENFISGVILLAGKQLRPGDVIEFNGIWGRVRKVSIRATVVDTVDNAVITFPNSEVLSKDFRNWSINHSLLRREIKVSTALGSDVEKVFAILQKAVSQERRILSKPAPEVLFTELGNKGMMFTVRFWTTVNDQNLAQSNLWTEITRAFQENGIQIPD